MIVSTYSADSDSDSEDPFIVEKIIKKRFNSNETQYEYLVKWVGYTESENPWKLMENVPKDKLLQKRTFIIGFKARATRQRYKTYGIKGRFHFKCVVMYLYLCI